MKPPAPRKPQPMRGWEPPKTTGELVREELSSRYERYRDATHEYGPLSGLAFGRLGYLLQGVRLAVWCKHRTLLEESAEREKAYAELLENYPLTP